MDQEKVKNFITQSRAAGVSDDQIYSFLQSKNVVPPLQQPEQVQPEQTGGIKQVVTEPFRTLVGQPGIRAGQAIGSLGLMLANKLSGGKVSEAVKARTGQTLEERLPGVVGQDVVSPGGTLLSKGVKQFSEGGGQQVVGEMLQSASYLYPFGTVAGAAGRAVWSKVAGNVISGATGGYLADVGYGLAEGEGAEALKPGMGTIIGGAIPTVGPVLRGTTKLTQEAVGKLTGTSGQTLREFGAAIRAGGTQADEAVKALRGQTSPEQIVENAKNALSDIVKKRNDEYVSALSKISDDTKTYDITPIVKNLKTQLDNFGTVLTPDGNLDFSRSPIRFNKQAQSEIQTIFDELKGFGLKPGDRTAVGIDSLKRSFQDLYSESSEARAFVESMRKSTRDILKQVPGYDELTAKYSQDTELINELRKGLSLGDKAQIDTTFKKLVSVLRTNNEMRLQLAREINAVAGDTLIPQIAGQQLSEVLPRGIIGQIGGVIGGASLLSGVGILPVIQAALVSSPRLVGEVIRVLGIAGRGATKVKNLLVPKNINLQFPGDALLESNLGKQATKYAKDYAKNPKLGLSIQDVSRLSKEELDQLGLSQTLKASPKKNISKTASANDIPTKLPKSKVMSSDLSTSIQKAKASGQSFDEWVKGQGETVYHGTNAKISEFNLDNLGKAQGFDESGIFFTSDKTRAKSFNPDYIAKPKYKMTDAEKLANEKLGVVDAVVDTKKAVSFSEIENLYKNGTIKTKPKLDGLTRPEQFFDNNRQLVKELKEKTDIPVIKVTAEGETQYLVLKPDTVKTRSQLKAEWDKVADTTNDITSSIKKAKQSGQSNVLDITTGQPLKYKETVNIQDKNDLEYLRRIFSDDTIVDIKNGKKTNWRGEPYSDIAGVNIISRTPKTIAQKLEGKIKNIKLKSDTFYHGTSAENAENIINQGFKFGKELPKDTFRGGGYGKMQNSISLAETPQDASRFSELSRDGKIIEVKLKPNSKVVSIEGVEDAIDLEDFIPYLKKQKVDAVYIGGGEKELVIINKNAVKPTRSQLKAEWDKIK